MEADRASGESRNKIDLVVVVGGAPTTVSANVNAPLQTVIEKALEQTGNVGQPPANWELKDGAGVTLDLHRKIEDFGFTPATRVFLNLKAGAAGAAR